MQRKSLIAAAVNWKLRQIKTRQEFFEHLDSLLAAAAEKNAELVVLPELFSLELIPLICSENSSEWPVALAACFPELQGILEASARKFNLTIVAGSTFRMVDGGIRNSCLICGPEDPTQIRDKINLVPYERRIWNLTAGHEAPRAATALIGVSICYDVQFPALVTELVCQGIQVLCVPALTDPISSFYRVRWCSHSRTVEFQIFVVMSCLVGNLSSHFLSGSGSAAVLGPPIGDFPENGVMAETQPNQEGLAVADLDFDYLADVRMNGMVQTWKEQFSAKDK